MPYAWVRLDLILDLLERTRVLVVSLQDTWVAIAELISHSLSDPHN